jgi:YVTN family beta-propeller protein
MGEVAVTQVVPRPDGSRRSISRALSGVLAALLVALPAVAYSPSAFVNWETPTVHPLDMTPDGTRLLAVNTADNRLEILDLTAPIPKRIGSIAVGLDPVSVRARSNTEAWVVNHVSDTISIVDLTLGNVVRTLKTLDEPCDVVFSVPAQRAFISCSQANAVLVFNLNDLTAEPVAIEIDGEDPRALAVRPDGGKVYVAIFESGNRSTILGGGGDPVVGTLGYPPNVVSDPNGPYGGVNPPPNSGAAFDPPIAPGLQPAVKVGLIVKQDSNDRWMDDNHHDWTDFVSGPKAAASGRPVGWHLVDHDVAVIDALDLSVSYVTRLMNLVMAIAVNPSTGDVSAVGTDALNEVRFEPVLNGRFLRVNVALIQPDLTAQVHDLNSHLTYASPTIPQVERNKSIGDPRAIVWNASGTRAYVAGMGSNNVVVINSSGARAGLSDAIPVGQGPVGLALDEPRKRLYVLNRFAGTISVVHTDTEQVIQTVAYYDPTPPEIRAGRKHLYDTHKTSGLGHISCASCHADARMDRLAWDLGDPQGTFLPVAGQNLGGGIFGLTPGTAPVPFTNFHPMKGPMTTQTLQDIIDQEPHHWRGDRDGIEKFNPAFMNLLGDDTPLTPAEMQEFEDFLRSIHYPPNPFRNFDNTLPTSMPLPGHHTTGRFAPAGQPLPDGNALNGMLLYRSTSERLNMGVFACVTCHTLPAGTGPNMSFSAGSFKPIAPGPNGETHHMLVSVDGSTNRSIKVPHLRNMYDKVGFDATQVSNRAGFGFLHDGSVDSLARFISEPVFVVESDQEVADLVAFMLCFAGSDLPDGSPTILLQPPGSPSRDAHAAVGAQVTIVNGAAVPPADAAKLTAMYSLAETFKVGLVAKGRQDGIQRGYAYLGGGEFRSDRVAETIYDVDLVAGAAPGSELTFTVVPFGSQTRIGIDRDLDGYYDRDELDACSDPADPTIVPGGPGSGLLGDLDGNGTVAQPDLGLLLSNFGCVPPATCPADIDGDGDTDQSDLGLLLSNYGKSCPAG